MLLSHTFFCHSCVHIYNFITFCWIIYLLYIIGLIDLVSTNVCNLLCNCKLLCCPLFLFLKFLDRFGNSTPWFLWSRCVWCSRRRWWAFSSPGHVWSFAVKPSLDCWGQDVEVVQRQLRCCPGPKTFHPSVAWPECSKMCQPLIRSRNKGVWSCWGRGVTSDGKEQRGRQPLTWTLNDGGLSLMEVKEEGGRAGWGKRVSKGLEAKEEEQKQQQTQGTSRE